MISGVDYRLVFLSLLAYTQTRFYDMFIFALDWSLSILHRKALCAHDHFEDECKTGVTETLFLTFLSLYVLVRVGDRKCKGTVADLGGKVNSFLQGGQN